VIQVFFWGKIYELIMEQVFGFAFHIPFPFSQHIPPINKPVYMRNYSENLNKKESEIFL
jgi:hypothetical protein